MVWSNVTWTNSVYSSTLEWRYNESWYFFVFEYVTILTFCAYCISDSYSAIHTVHYTNTHTNSLPPHSARSVWHLPLVPEDSWTYLLTCCVLQFRADYRQLTADCCCAVMLKSKMTGSMLDLCTCIQISCDREGKLIGRFCMCERLKT